MRKNLHNQLVKKLLKLKHKNKFMFLQHVCLNTNFNSSKTRTKSTLLKLTILLYSKQLQTLKKKNVFNTQLVSQCYLTWRTRSVYSFFNLSRITLRELVHFGFIKGLKKSSW